MPPEIDDFIDSLESNGVSDDTLAETPEETEPVEEARPDDNATKEPAEDKQEEKPDWEKLLATKDEELTKLEK